MRRLYVLLVLVLFVCTTLLYLDWRRTGEIEFLHERVDSIDGLHGREYIARILRAHDDAAAEAAAREGR